MDDKEFLAAFHEGQLASSEFRHRGHLRLAWLILKQHLLDEAARIVSHEIRRFAAQQAAPGRYHETLTRFWVQLVSHALRETPDAKSVDELIVKFPLLLEKDLPYRHWSRPSFDSQDAKTGWVPPDLPPLP